MRFYQFIPEKRLLEEFDMVGIMRRQTYFEEEFREIRIVAIDNKRLRCLVTPEAG